MTFVEQEIAHITGALAIFLQGETHTRVLPAAYWRERLHKLLDNCPLAHGQLCAVDALLQKLDRFQARSR